MRLERVREIGGVQSVSAESDKKTLDVEEDMLCDEMKHSCYQETRGSLEIMTSRQISSVGRKGYRAM